MPSYTINHPKADAFNPGASAELVLALRNEAGGLIPATTVTAATATLQDLSCTGEVLNGRRNLDVTTGWGSLTDGQLILTLDPADTALVEGQSKPYQERLLYMTVAHGTGPDAEVLGMAVYFWVRNPHFRPRLGT